MAVSGARVTGVSRRADQSLLGKIGSGVGDIMRYRYLVKYLTSSALRTEHVGTVFGFLWWLFDPLMLMGVYTVLIDVVLNRGEKNFPLFVLAAILPWESFTRAMRNSMGTTLSKERAMRQVAFPKAVIPLSSTIAQMVHLSFALVMYLFVAIPFGIDPSFWALMTIPISIVLFVLTLAFSFFLAALNVFFRDTMHLTNHLFRLWFYLSPSLYSADRVPHAYRRIFDLNPMATIFESYRSVLYYHEAPSYLNLGYTFAGGLVALVIGFSYFVVRERSFAKID